MDYTYVDMQIKSEANNCIRFPIEGGISLRKIKFNSLQVAGRFVKGDRSTPVTGTVTGEKNGLQFEAILGGNAVRPTVESITVTFSPAFSRIYYTI